MEQKIKNYNIITGFVIFACLPLLLYSLQTYPARTLLKESLSIVTIIAFSLMFSQFFISRINTDIKYANKMNKILNFHKYLGYVLIGVLFFHPFFIVLPRYFEAGVDPLNAFWLLITSFDNLGVVAGILSWCFMLIIGITSFLRFKMGLEYKHWKTIHSSLSLIFIFLATLHVIILGRHSEYPISIFFILLVGISIVKLLQSKGTKSER